MASEKDIKAIKAALKFLIEREMNRALVEDMPDYTGCIFPKAMSRSAIIERQREKIKAPFLDVLKGLE